MRPPPSLGAQAPFALLAPIAPEWRDSRNRGSLYIRSQPAKEAHFGFCLWRPKFRSRHWAETGSITEWWVIRLGPKLFRVETEDLELLAPFGRQIAEALDADAAGQATFGRFDEIRCEERE